MSIRQKRALKCIQKFSSSNPLKCLANFAVLNHCRNVVSCLNIQKYSNNFLHMDYNCAADFDTKNNSIGNSFLSEALLASQTRGEQTKIFKFEFAPLASSTMYANTLRPRILVLTSFVWS